MKLLLVVTSGAAFLWTPLAVRARPGPSVQEWPPPASICSGNPCIGDYTAFPNPGWTIDGFPQDGQGRGGAYSNCDPCKDCFAFVDWEYQGSSFIEVYWSTGQTQGWGPISGTFRATTACDAVPHNDQFIDWDNGIVWGALYCTCP